jgi:hypothetical protein
MEDRIKLLDQAILEAQEAQLKLVKLEIQRMKMVSLTIAITAALMAFVVLL